MNRMLIVLTALVMGYPTPANAREKSYALVVGYNGTLDPQQSPLRYADDDAVLYAELLSQLSVDVSLLYDPDPDTQALYPHRRPQGAPTRAGIESAMWGINKAIEQVHRDGHTATLYIVYTGHGDVQHGEGVITLADGAFSRSDLFREVLDRSAADVEHVIIDACKSYFMVFERGPTVQRDDYERPFADRYELANRPNTGFLLSTSSGQESHEWEAFQAGVFSHEVRSGLRGAADVNGDSKVTYTELAAFVQTANRAVRNPRFRPRFLAVPPVDDETLVASDGVVGRRLVFDVPESHHFVVESAVGVRLVDMRVGSHQAVVLVPPEGTLFVRNQDTGLEYRADDFEQLRLSALVGHPPTTEARGAPHEAFQKLFQVPFGAQSLEDPALAQLVLRRNAGGTENLRVARVPAWGWSAMGASALAVTGGLLTHRANQFFQAYQNAPNSQTAAARRDVERRDRGATAAYVGAGLGAVTTAVLFILERIRGDDEEQ